MTFDLPLAQVDAGRIEALRADGVREGRQLEYKEVLPSNNDDDKREFLSDVTSFANTAGGDLIFGLRERRDTEGKPTGEIDAVVGLQSFNLDAERLRLEAMMRDAVAPRMPPVTFHEIRREPNPPCLLLRIPRSWAALHMVTFRNLSRFFARGSGGKYQLDVHEIRAGFVAAETAYERLRRLRAERVTRVAGLETPVPVGDGAKLVLHALPVGGLEDAWSRFLVLIGGQAMQHETQIASMLQPVGQFPATWGFNLDGYVLHTLDNDLSRQCYTQLFREGGLEIVSGRVLVRVSDGSGFYGWGMEGAVIGCFARYQEFWRVIGVTPPLLVGLTLIGVKGWTVLRQPYHFSTARGTFDRDVVMSPEIVMTDLNIPADIVLRPLFDFLWNGGGWAGSPNYRDGRWVAPTT